MFILLPNIKQKRLIAVCLFLFWAMTCFNAFAKKQFPSLTSQDLKMLGVVNLPKNIVIQESYKGIKFFATPSKRYSNEQIILLKFFIDRTPSALLEYGPDAIVNAEAGFLPSMAQASGPFVFFESTAFNTDGFWSAGSLEDVFRGFIHELVHVYQFRKALETIDLEKARTKFKHSRSQTLWDFAVMDTNLIGSFANITEWKLDKGCITTARLTDFKNAKTSNYGRVSIMEDMAETVSLVTIGDLTPLSDQRIQWAINFLGYKSLEAALKDTFPYSKQFELVKMGSSITKFNHDKVQEYKKKYKISDVAHFVSKNDGHFQEIVSILAQGFSNRGWKNILTKDVTLKHNIKKHIFEYQGKWRDVYIEVISYEDATGYLRKPEKSIITVLSGYKL